MSSPRTSQVLDQEQESAVVSSINRFSWFQEQAKREREERQSMLIKTQMIALGSLLLKLDNTVDMTDIQLLANILKQNSTSTVIDSDSDSDAEEYNAVRIFNALSEKIEKAMKPFVARYMQDEANAKNVNDLSIEDVMRLMKPKYVAEIVEAIINSLLSEKHANEFETGDRKLLKEFSIRLEYTKPTVEIAGVVDFLLALSYKNQDTKKMVHEALTDYYMAIYCVIANQGKKPEDEKIETVEQSQTFKLT